MREIIFRGKRTDNGAWVEGYITRRPSAIQYEAHYSPWFIDKPPSDPDDSGGFYNVYRETIGQFTGLEDKNGNRIFEGDILEYFICEDWKYRGVVTANIHNCGCCHSVYGFSICDKGGEPTDDLSFYNAEVIGNIHDNPELLNTNEEREAEE